MSKTTTTRYDVAEHLRTPDEMAAYLETCFEEANGDAAFIAKALGDLARAKGMSQVARDAGLSRESLYKALSGERNPNFDTILKVIVALGLKLHAGSGLIDEMHDVLIENLNVASKHSTAIFDASHNGIVVTDRDGIVLVFNLAARQIFDETDRSFVGQHFSEIRPEAWPDLQKILKTGLPQIGKRVDLPQASIVVNRKPIVVGNEIVGVISVFQDISEYEKMITELQGFKELHAKLEAVIESSHDGLVLSDYNGVILMQNQSFERLTGLARKEMIGRRAKDLLREGYVDQSITLEVLKQKRKVTALQTCKTGKQVLVTGNPIYDENGKVSLVVMNVRDLTELNRLKSQLQDSEQIRNRLYKSLLEREGKAKVMDAMVVRSPAMNQVVERASRVAGGDTPVFLQGPSGVGKNMLAKLIHQISSRKEGPFIKINCGAIPENLLESELFGYEKGAFTGADPAGKAGLVEAGNGGTVFLDEVTEISSNLQVKLLEIIEEKTFTQVGGIRPKSVDVRIVAASNRDLKQMIQQGEFREDLYFRLNVFPINIPPLYRRPEDIAALADHFINKMNRDRRLNKRLSREVMDKLIKYTFPGNVRELVNILEQMVIMSDGERIGIEDIPLEIRTSESLSNNFYKGDKSLKEAVETIEKKVIEKTVHDCQDLTQAARKLGISSSTLWRKMTRYAIKSHHSNMQ